MVFTAWLWLSLLSPWMYSPPPGLPVIDESAEHRVFAYGTLRFSALRWLVVGRRTPSQPALLPGFRKEGLDVQPARDAQTRGGVLGEVFEVSPEELRRLDRYERLGVRYERIAITLDDGQEAWVYRRLPASNAKTESPL